jgi:hypothetical protein
MEKTDPHQTHSYSNDWMLMTAFDFELRNHLAVKYTQDNEKAIIEQYLQNRVKEIKDRWK